MDVADFKILQELDSVCLVLILDETTSFAYDKSMKETGKTVSRKKLKGWFSMKYECPCGYIYDPETGDPDSGIAPGTAWEDIPEDWVCPVCGLGKDAFTPV